MHADLFPVLATSTPPQEIALSTGLQIELASTSLHECVRRGAGQDCKLAGPQGAFSQEICACVACSCSTQQCIKRLHATAVLSACLSLRPGTRVAPGISACGMHTQRLSSDKVISTPRCHMPSSQCVTCLVMCAGQVWPHVSVVLSNIGQDRLPGLLQQHKPKWMAEVKLHSFFLGNKPPSITSAKVGAS